MCKSAVYLTSQITTIIYTKGVHLMANKFKINKIEYVNRTFRLPSDLVDALGKAASDAGVSMNEFVIQAVEYALDNLDTNDKNAK